MGRGCMVGGGDWNKVQFTWEELCGDIQSRAGAGGGICHAENSRREGMGHGARRRQPLGRSGTLWGVGDEAGEVAASLDAKLRALALSWEQWGLHF